jgi:SAM-dependent methyltransferase
MKKESFTRFWLLLEDKKQTKKRANWVLKAIAKHHKNAKKVLELGTGLGQVLLHFPRNFEVYGLDNNEEYVKIAKRRIPRGKFFVSSMHNFKIDKKFDVICSIYDSICFLKNFSQWKSTFKAADEHLNVKGLFIFDTYTSDMLNHFKKQKPSMEEYAWGTIHDKALVKGNTLTWDFKVHENVGKGKVKVHQFLWKETLFPFTQIKSALLQRFKILEIRTLEKNRRIQFICQKK